MARLYNTFEFIGNISIPKDREKFYNVNESDSGWVGHRINFAIQESKTNSVFVEMYGGYSKAKQNIIKTLGKKLGEEEGGVLEIPWEDRLKPNIIDMVANFRKVIIDFTINPEEKQELRELIYKIRNIEMKETLTDSDKEELNNLNNELREKYPNRYEFIHNYDAVLLLANKLEDYKDYRFRITGNIDFTESKGKFYRTFNVQTIEIVTDDEIPNGLKMTVDIFFTKDSLDDSDLKKNKKIYINGYLLSYDYKTKKDQFFPQQFVINAEKIDFENERQVALLNILKKHFQVNGRGVYHLLWEAKAFRGADRVEFTYDDLTPQQKELVEFGLNKVEDFAPKGGLLGETKEENRLIKPVLKQVNSNNDFRNGAIETVYTEDDLVFKYTVNETKESKTSLEKLEESSPQIDLDKELDNLFG